MRTGDAIALVDPESGERVDLPVPVGFDEWPRLGWAAVPGQLAPARTPGGARVFLLLTGGEAALARFDPELQRMVVAQGTLAGSPRVFLVALLDEERALVLRDGDTIAQVRFGTTDYVERFTLR